MKVKLILILLFSGSSFWAFSQTLDQWVLSSEGRTSQGVSTQLEWTLGESAIATMWIPGGMITEGFHQPILKIEEQSILPQHWLVQESELLTTDIRFELAPNPVKSIMSLKVKSKTEGEVLMELFSISGQPLQKIHLNIPSDGFQYDLSDYPSGMYFLRFSEKNGSLLKVFKITKIQ